MASMVSDGGFKIRLMTWRALSISPTVAEEKPPEGGLGVRVDLREVGGIGAK